ncbi:hypothetical protein GCM10023161_08830 [Mycobacterium paraffinicum]|uniref:Uncharacterized protein n=1 Tax=Mycobacterium paraffinicum TaxID=53378 RepID=A0ABP8RCK4_9MYCO
MGPPIGGGGGPCCSAIIGGGPGGSGGPGGPALMIQAKAIAAMVPAAPISAPATPTPTTIGVEWRRGSRGGWAAGGGAGGWVSMSSFVVMAPEGRSWN